MKLYYSPGACSLSPHIALVESGLPYQLERVDLRATPAKVVSSGKEFLSVNPKSYVPALVLDDGQLLTEGAVIVQYIADRAPGSKLAPPAGTMERYRLQEWLNFVATELHKGFGPLMNPKTPDEIRQSTRDRVRTRFQFLATGLAARPYLMGNDFSVADGYAYYTLRSWRRWAEEDFAKAPPPLPAFFERVASRPAVKKALEEEGITA